MKDMYKIIAHDLFQKFIVCSILLVPCFFWPNHEPRLMKYICFQTFVNILLVSSFAFKAKRTIDSPYPALFLILSFINLFTHGMSDFVNIGVSFIMFSVVGVYVLSNYIHDEYIPVIKKTIVLMCLLNCALFLIETAKIQLIFNIDKGYERASGFVCYPSSFALLCAISLFFAWGWRKWLCIPIIACLILSKEYSVILGLIVAISIPFWKHYGKILLPLVITAIGLYVWKDWGTIHGKLIIRMRYIYPVIQNCWARPIDGWGVGMYNRLPESFFGFDRGNWSEMHCEPLDLFFSMGILGVACVTGWIKSVMNMTMTYKMILTVIIITSCFHSILHFGDTLYICILVYALMEIERYDTN